MPTLAQLLDCHQSLLCLDAASETVHVGLIRSDGPTVWARQTEGAGTGVFAALQDLDVRPSAAGAFMFCEGPGSILGIRTAAMAIRAWQVEAPRPAFAYTSLVVAGFGHEDVTVIADARRGLWHVKRPGESLARVPASALTGPMAMPEGFRHWAPLPEGVGRLPYDPSAVFSRHRDEAFFREVREPDAFLQEEPSYAIWTPQVHRAP